MLMKLNEGEKMRARAAFSFLTILLGVGVFIVWGGNQSGTLLYIAKIFAFAETTDQVPEPPNPSHLKTPVAVKALYMTSWVAGTPHMREHVVDLLRATEANAVVIDIKDDTGRIAYLPYDLELRAIGSGLERVADIREFIERLHRLGIYVIGRVAVFQDPYMTKLRPDLAVRRASDGAIWRDRKGLSWIDPGSREQWEYVAKIALDAYRFQGFDELNFDYIRFPSDGNMGDIAYRHYDEQRFTKPEQLKRFFAYLHDRLLDSGAVTSVDFFGMTTTNTDDLGIGQVLETALPYFDFISPMVYPSHYPPTWNGFSNPAANPYAVVKIAMGGAVERAKAASTTPQKLRPWLQDFNLGADYTAEMVRAQIRATYDVGLSSWSLWDPKNKYTPGALLPE